MSTTTEAVLGEHRLRLELEVLGPVLTRSTSPGDYGVHAPIARNADDRPMLPASLLKGKLREAWQELQAIAPEAVPQAAIDRWLGVGYGEDDIDADRGRLILGDLVAGESADAEEADNQPSAGAGGGALRYRIRIDDDLGSVEPHFLQLVESPFAAGETVRFTGHAHFVPGSDDEAPGLRRLLEQGLRWITSVGALRTAGFGRVVGAEVVLEPLEAPAGGKALEGELLGLRLTVADPLLISSPQPLDNLFQGLDQVPGAVIKGALASTWNELMGRRLGRAIGEGSDPQRAELAAHFEDLRFTHAFPAPKSPGGYLRPVEPPLSAAVGGTVDGFVDLLRAATPVLLRRRTQAGENESEPASWEAPAFAPDWKWPVGEDIRRQLGWATDLRRELRVHTAIDAATRRADEGRLFAHELVHPRDDVAWVGRVDLSRVPKTKRSVVAVQLQDLLRHGLRHLGKTQARGRAVLRPMERLPAAVARHRSPDTGQRAVVLQTPALLVAPEALRPAVDLRAAYETVWRELLGSAGAPAEVRLLRFFTAQDLFGGKYLFHRFLKSRSYQPFALTRAGSAFLLQLPDDAAAGREVAERLDALATTGLPLPGWAVERFRRDDVRDGPPGGLPGDHWRCCPYIPQNGYGEIAVDLALHWDRAPVTGTFQTLKSAEVSS